MIEKDTLVKIGTLGGAVKVRKDLKGYYFGSNQAGGNFSKEKLFGAHGPLHPGMQKEEVAVGALHSDTRSTLVRELADQTHLTRREAEDVVEDLLRKGVLEEVNDPTLGKVLVFKGGV